MRICDFVNEATRAGIAFEIPEPGRLTVEGPDDALDHFLPEIKQRKAEILDYLGPDPVDGLLDALAEYDKLIHRLCDLRAYPPEHRTKLIDARRRMAPADLPGDLEQFRQIAARQGRAAA